MKTIYIILIIVLAIAIISFIVYKNKTKIKNPCTLKYNKCFDDCIKASEQPFYEGAYTECSNKCNCKDWL